MLGVLLVMTYYMIAIDFLMVLFFKEYLAFMGLNDYLALLYSLILVIALHTLSYIDIKFSRKLRKFSYEVPIVIDIDKVVLHAEAKVRGKALTYLAINATGFIASLIISLTLLGKYLSTALMNDYDINSIILLMISAIVFLTILHNRLVRISHNYVGIPMVKSITVTTLIGVVIGIYYGPLAALSITYVASFTSLLLGADLIEIKGVLRYNPEVISIGGMGLLDALILIPSLSSIISYATVLLMNSI